MGYKTIIAAWNANGLAGKLGHLRHFLSSHKVDIALIGETRLQAGKNVSMRGAQYDILRRDRSDGSRFGGVVVLVKSTIPYKVLPHTNSSIESISIQLEDGLVIVAVYNSPGNKITPADLDVLHASHRRVILVGDFNARHEDWSLGRDRNNANGITVHDYVATNGLEVIHTDRPTHFPPNGSTPSTIDIIINKNLTNLSKPLSIDELTSDHNPVVFEIANKYSQINSLQKTTTKNTNWPAFRSYLDKRICINNRIETTDELETEVGKFTSAVSDALKHNTQTQTIKRTHDKTLPQHTLDLIKEKNRIRKLWQRTQNKQHKEHMYRLTREITREIHRQTNEQWTKKLQSLQPGDNSLWRFTRSLKNKQTQRTTPNITHNNTTHFTDAAKAEAIASTFEQVHVIDHANDTPFHTHVSDQCRLFIDSYDPATQNTRKLLTNPTEILSFIKTLRNNKAPGPDGITNLAIKNLTKKALVQFTYITNAILKLGHFPDHWKIACVVPIHKAGKDPSLPTSYRPISLLPCLAKLVEKVILQRIDEVDRKRAITPHAQFGFRAHHSTTQQVVRIVNDICVNFNKGNVTAMLLLDIQKAFDRVWIEGLVYKLILLNIPPAIIKLIHSYLTNRMFEVKIRNAKSQPKVVAAGVPQGSVLGPRLFSLFLHDIPTFPRTNLAMYADDTAIYCHSFSAIVANKQLQIHLNLLAEYYKRWHIQVNPDKTENIIFSRKFNQIQTFQPIILENQRIPTSESVKYLGVHLDRRLSYHKHIQETLRRAYGVQRTLYPLLARNSGLTRENKKLVYTALVRPMLTYACPVWCSISDTAYVNLQRFQNKCLRLATGLGRYARIARLHELATIDTITDHVRRISDKFYETQLSANPLLNNITNIRSNFSKFKIKHKLPYQRLDIFSEPLPSSRIPH